MFFLGWQGVYAVVVLTIVVVLVVVAFAKFIK